MPIQIIVSEGLVSESGAQAMHHQVCQAFLDVHEITDNAFMGPNIVGEVVFMNPNLTFAGQKPTPLAIVELRVPAFTFGTQQQKDQFVSRTTDIVFDACNGKLPRSAIWVNAVYAVDGLWGIAGKAYSNAELMESIQQAAV